MILIVIWKRSAWAFYPWVVAWSLIGSATAHPSALKKRLVFKYESSLPIIIHMKDWHRNIGFSMKNTLKQEQA